MDGKRSLYFALHFPERLACCKKQLQKKNQILHIHFIKKIKKYFMSCCGKKRTELLHQHTFQHPQPGNYNFAMSPASDDVQFKYTGSTALTAIGAVTGKKYRFVHTGHIQTIDYRD